MLLYGMRVEHPRLPAEPAPPTPPRLDWHRVDLHEETGPAPDDTVVHWDGDRVELRVAGHRRVVVRHGETTTATVVSPVPLAAPLLVHPTLTFVAYPLARWTGRTMLHAGAVVVDDRAWLFLAESEGGKSTLARALDRRGLEVMADDMVVLDGTTVLAGPRASDLRRESRDALAEDAHLLSTPVRERWRSDLGPCRLEAPLGGFVHLAWGEGPRVERVALPERITGLHAAEAFKLQPVGPATFLDLAALPHHRLVRPRDFDRVEATIEALLELTARS